MGSDIPPRILRKYKAVLDETGRWLNEHVDTEDLQSEVARMAAKLRAYLAHCHRRLARDDETVEGVDQRRAKIERACVMIWDAISEARR